MNNQKFSELIDTELRIDALWQEHRRVRDKFIVFKRKQKLDTLEKEIEVLDKKLTSIVISLCAVSPLTNEQKHFDTVLRSALSLDGSYEGLMPDDDKKDDEEMAMLDVSSTDTQARIDWFNKFLAAFPNLSLDAGWRISAMTLGNRYGRWAKFFLADDKGNFCKDIFEHIRVVGDRRLGAIEAAMLDYARDRIGLFWHALYRQGWLILDIPTLDSTYNSDRLRSMILNVCRKYGLHIFSSFDFSPSVTEINDNLCEVKYSVASITSGFFSCTARVHTNGVIGCVETHRDELFKYDNGIRY